LDLNSLYRLKRYPFWIWRWIAWSRPERNPKCSRDFVLTYRLPKNGRISKGISGALFQTGSLEANYDGIRCRLWTIGGKNPIYRTIRQFPPQAEFFDQHSSIQSLILVKTWKICASHAGAWRLAKMGLLIQILEDLGMMKNASSTWRNQSCVYTFQPKQAYALPLQEAWRTSLFKIWRPVWTVFTPANQKFWDWKKLGNMIEKRRYIFATVFGLGKRWLLKRASSSREFCWGDQYSIRLSHWIPKLFGFSS